MMKSTTVAARPTAVVASSSARFARFRRPRTPGVSSTCRRSKPRSAWPTAIESVVNG